MLRSTFSLPLEPPAPVAAVYTLSTDTVVVTFDKLLYGPAPSGAKWTGVVTTPAALSFTGFGPATIDRRTLTFNCLRGAPGIPPAVVNYLDAPSDIFGKEGAPVAAFAGFPLTVLP